MKFRYIKGIYLSIPLRFLVVSYYYLCFMINELKFIANDFTLNCYGFKVDTAGIDLSRHTNTNTTPAFYNHDRSEMPLGVWRNFSKKEGKLVATGLELDMEDEDAIEMARKIELGHLNSVSMGLIVNEFKQIGNDIVAVRSELLELSIVDVPANKNAIRLYEMNAEGNLVHLSIPEFESKKPALSTEIEDLTPNENEMENVTKEQFENLSMRMDAQENELKTLKAENVSLKAELTAEKDSKVTVKDLLQAVQAKELAHPKEEETLLSYFEKRPTMTKVQIYKEKGGDEKLAQLRVSHPDLYEVISNRK